MIALISEVLPLGNSCSHTSKPATSLLFLLILPLKGYDDGDLVFSLRSLITQLYHVSLLLLAEGFYFVKISYISLFHTQQALNFAYASLSVYDLKCVSFSNLIIMLLLSQPAAENGRHPTLQILESLTVPFFSDMYFIDLL